MLSVIAYVVAAALAMFAVSERAGAQSELLAAVSATAFAIFSAIHLYCRIALGGYTAPLPAPKAGKLAAAISWRQNRPEFHTGKTLVVITGGTGFLGCAVVRRLVETGLYRVAVVDLAPPSVARRVAGVIYHVADLARQGLDVFFEGADAVVHTAGVVDLTADAAVTYNAHVVVTHNVLEAALRCGVRAVVATSSIGAVTSPYVQESQTNLPADYLPPGYASGTFASGSSYSTTKLAAEQTALSLDASGFRVCALRCPMIFGLDDPLVVAPILRGELDRVPDMGANVHVEFVYVENAAAAHCCALAALLREVARDEMAAGKAAAQDAPPSSERPCVSGRAYNVTNGDAPMPSFELWQQLVLKAIERQKQLGRPKPHLRPLRSLPYGLLFVVACVAEAVFALCCSRVPKRRHTFWNLTRASLRLSGTSVTQSLEATRRDLGFVPEFSTLQAFDHMMASWQG